MISLRSIEDFDYPDLSKVFAPSNGKDFEKIGMRGDILANTAKIFEWSVFEFGSELSPIRITEKDTGQDEPIKLEAIIMPFKIGKNPSRD